MFPNWDVWLWSHSVFHVASLNTRQLLLFAHYLLSVKCLLFSYYYYDYFFLILCSNRSKNNPATPEKPAISPGAARGIVGAERIPGTPALRCIAPRSQITFYFMLPSPSILLCPEWVSRENDRSARHSRRQVVEEKNKNKGFVVAAMRDLPAIWYQTWASSGSTVPNVSLNWYIWMISQRFMIS